MKQYELEHLITTDKDILEWIQDFQAWLESRGETSGGTIRPYVEEENSYE